MNQITLLVELQHLDTRSDENASARDLLETKLANTSELESARAALESSDKESAAYKSQLHSLELETSSLTEKLQEVSSRLYSGRITNAKELSGLNQDEKMLQRRKSELEDKELALMEQIEATDNALRDRRAAYAKVEADTKTHQAQDRASLRELEEKEAALSYKRDALRGQLPVETLRVYDDLRRMKKGRAVVSMKFDSCAACGYAVPSGLLARVKQGNELVFCSNCGRIVTP